MSWLEGTVTVIKLGPLENPTRGGRSLPRVLKNEGGACR
jgi:hypothetical protein